MYNWIKSISGVHNEHEVLAARQCIRMAVEGSDVFEPVMKAFTYGKRISQGGPPPKTMRERMVMLEERN